MVNLTSDYKALKLGHGVHAAIENDNDNNNNISISNLCVDMTGCDDGEFGDTDEKTTIRGHSAIARHCVLRCKSSRANIDTPDDKPSEYRKTDNSNHRREEDEMLEMHESIQSMISFLDFVENSDERMNKIAQSVQSADESTGSILPPSNFGIDDGGKVNNTPGGKAFDNLFRIPLSATKSSCTITTVATTASSEPCQSLCRGSNQEDQDGDDDHDEYDDEYPFDYEEQCINVSNNESAFVTPLIRQSRRASGYRNKTQNCVPSTLHSMGLLLVSPLSADPSPGHKKVSIAHQDLLDEIQSNDLVNQKPIPTQAPHRKGSLVRLLQRSKEYGDGAEIGGNGSMSQRSNLSEAFSVPPTPLDYQSHSGSPSVLSMSTVSSRLLHHIPRTILDTDDCGPPTTRTRSISCSWGDDELDFCTGDSSSFSHLEERPPTPVKRRQRLRSRKVAYSSRQSDASERVSSSSSLPSTKLRADKHGTGHGSRKIEGGPKNVENPSHPETPQWRSTSVSSNSSKSSNSSFRSNSGEYQRKCERR
jgi:hypothetical protein